MTTTGREHMSGGGTDRGGIRSGLWLPLFDELADPVVVPYDVAVGLPLGTDPMPYAAAGATWWMPDLDPDALSLDEVRGVLRDGPVPAP